MEEKKKIAKKNIKIDDDLIEELEIVQNQYTGNLKPTDQNTVQPIALMRLGLFVPTLKSTNNRNNKKGSVIDATEELI
ncbi:MAG: replication initiation protein, partial [Enterobacter sp.]|nr:replication initiation protein [Enterobacter sp.]